MSKKLEQLAEEKRQILEALEDVSKLSDEDMTILEGRMLCAFMKALDIVEEQLASFDEQLALFFKTYPEAEIEEE